MKSFLARFGQLVSFVLSGFDRLRFCGESRRLNNARGVDSYLYQLKIRYTDFPAHAESLTKTLCTQTEKLAQQQGVPLQHLDSPTIDKEATALELAERCQLTTGRVALLTCVESCSTYRLRKNQIGYIKPVKERGRCLHYYHYFLHADLGLCYVRVQSWFPFAIRIGMNGRQWLYRQLEQRGVPFQRRNNLLLSVGNPALAQELLDEQRRADWPTVFGDLVRPLQPLWVYLHGTADTPYYWMTEQSEWATDFLFRSPSDLAEWYPRWIKYGIETLQCRDVLRYLGKKVTSNGYVPCGDEVKIDLRQRPEGTRLKFWQGTNSLKIYDKEAHALRIETTINQPQGYKVYRAKEGQADDAPKSWQIMRKGVADLDRRAEVSQASNNRLAESLATVTQTTTLGELLRPLGQPVIEHGRRKARPLNPLTGADGTLMRALAQGDFLLNGFRNRDLRMSLHGQPPNGVQCRRQAAQVTRQLALLRAHGLIIKVATTHRYHLSASGRRIVTALLNAHTADVNRLAESA
jgi:hypothetical protein